MITGTAELNFVIHGCNSLKEKRGIVRSIIDRTKNKYVTAIAEVGKNDLQRYGQLGLAVVSNSRRDAESKLREILKHIKSMHLVNITEVNIEFF